MKETFRVCIIVRHGGEYLFKTTQNLSRWHLVDNLNRMLREGRITGWKIYDGSTADHWETDQTAGCF